MTQEREILMSSRQEYQSDARDKDKTTTARRIRGSHPAFTGMTHTLTLDSTTYQRLGGDLHNIVVGVVEDGIF